MHAFSFVSRRSVLKVRATVTPGVMSIEGDLVDAEFVETVSPGLGFTARFADSRTHSLL
jgi:hypothetical protein